jgi:hypothetical protein
MSKSTSNLDSSSYDYSIRSSVKPIKNHQQQYRSSMQKKDRYKSFSSSDLCLSQKLQTKVWYNLFQFIYLKRVLYNKFILKS